ncbi:MAG: hypothetical protein NC416_13125 [Eubacterium sp.]|nr:hypothetical protein [Eubacterium sp.]
MGFISFFTGAISAVGNFISGAVSSIGSFIGGFAKGVVGAVAKIGIGSIEVVAGAINFVGEVMHEIVNLLGIKSEVSPEILGAKAVQAEQNIEDFDGDAEAYIQYLKEEIELDKEKFNQMTSEEKLGCEVIGITLETKAVEKKLGGIEISEESLAELGKIHMAGIDINAGKLLDIIKVLKESGITNMDDVVDFIEERGKSDRIKTGEVLEHAIGEGAEEKIEQLQEAARKYEED